MAPALERDEAVNQFTILDPADASVGEDEGAVVCNGITDMSYVFWIMVAVAPALERDEAVDRLTILCPGGTIVGGGRCDVITDCLLDLLCSVPVEVPLLDMAIIDGGIPDKFS